ncbi:MAG: hypothetical protein JST00_04740 [Deltaproteobacteria bacterium]|nr:hypothetical protein [Deltaproteobacteria bacterium]
MRKGLGSERVLFLVVTALVAGGAACKKGGGDEKGTTLSSAVTGKDGVAAKTAKESVPVEVPPVARLVPKRTFQFGGVPMTVELCRFDASAPKIFATESSAARAPLAAAPDGSLWVLDHERRLRHYVNGSARGCELALDRTFGQGGILDLAAAGGGTERFLRVVVDAKGVVYLTGDSTKKLEGGKLVDHCAGAWMRTDPTTTLAVGSRTKITKSGGCEATNATFQGFDPNAPQYASPKAIGLFGDEVVVHGVDMDGKREIPKIGLHAPTGAQRVKMGGKDGDEWITSPESATKCGDDLCVYGSSFSDIGLSRFTRDGKLVQKVRFTVDGLKDSAMTTGGDGTLWIHGAMSGSLAEKPGEAPKEGFAGVILRMRAAPADAPPPSPAVAKALAAPRGDEPAHETLVGPVKGTLRGQPLLASTLAFEYRAGSWRLVVRNAKGSHLSTQLLVPPAAGAVSLSRAAGPKANSNAFLTTVDNAPEKMSSDLVGSAAHWIVVDRWDVKPYDRSSKSTTQDAGYASGRVWIDMPHTDSKGKNEDSRVAGVFEDAVVTYLEDPSAAKKE